MSRVECREEYTSFSPVGCRLCRRYYLLLAGVGVLHYKSIRSNIMEKHVREMKSLRPVFHA